jgi:uncharacterized circularly permuted ATP-grasp superfamily protein
MLDDLIARYHDLLARDTIAADSQAHLDQQTAQRQLYFGKRPVCTVLRPRLLTPQQYALLRQAVHALLPAFAVADRHAASDPAFRQQFCLRDWEETLLEIDPGFTPSYPTSRLDAFYTSEAELKFTEFNTETPAGVGYHDVLSEIFQGMPVVQEFTRQVDLQPLPSRPGVLHALLAAYRQWAGNTSTRPRIAIVDWQHVPTASEFTLMADYFRSQGLECRIVDPRDIEWAEGGLRVGDYRFDLIYKRVLINELIQQGGLDHPIVRAVRQRAVCMVNTFGCKPLFKKASFAVLSDERNHALFTPEQHQAIARFIPWTRLLQERHTTYANQTIDLVPWTLANRERLVLKPNDEYGGKGIVLGWVIGQTEWERAVTQALTEPTVVQERVNLPREVFPSYEGGQLHLLERMLDTDPFVLLGERMHSCLTRISTEALLNVTAGGGSTVPTFIVHAD